MPAIKKTNTPELFNRVRAAGDSMQQLKDCAVVAVAAVCKVSYEVAHAELARHGRIENRGTPRIVIFDAIKGLGFKTSRASMVDIFARFPEPHCRVLKNLTTHHPRRFPGSFPAGKTYLAFVNGHVLAIVDGEVMDWSINNSLRIHDLYEVTEA